MVSTTEKNDSAVQESVSMKALLEAGVHFGHQTQRWHPRMKQYIFTQRNGIHIIDLQQTLGLLESACKFISKIAEEGKSILFVGTKRQAQDAVKHAAHNSDMFFLLLVYSYIPKLRTTYKFQDELLHLGMVQIENLIIFCSFSLIKLPSI